MNKLPIENPGDVPKNVKAFLKRARAFIEDHYGDRCKTRCHGCKCCEMWALYDLLEISIGENGRTT